ncbi:MAG: ABC transporter substrate binding protein [Candidatus Marinarcus sp.]|uniref:sensor histidine kinase n=1 Tax=Candidatus Marinarcus sp. TaxID=3100987 RepID=UPI003B004390
MKLLFICVFLLLQLLANEKNEVLLLHSYNKGLKWSDGISNGISAVFAKHPEYELTTEYMDSKKIDSQAYFDALVKLYEIKYSKREYKAIITADNYAYFFALKNHNKLFHGVPIVFCGLENFDKNTIPNNEQESITGVIEYKEIKRNIELIENIIPNLSTIFIVSDSTLSSLSIKEQILEAANVFQNKIDVVYDNQLDIASLYEKTQNLPQNSAILFTSLYVNKFGEYIPYSQIKAFFSHSKYPVFSVNTIHLGEGVIGGIMLDPYEQGKAAAIKIFEIIEGKKPSEIAISKPVSKYYFDAEVLKKYEINESAVPVLSTIINQPAGFFDKNREFVNSTFIMIPCLVLLILWLIATIMRKISLEIKLVEQNKLDSVLLNNIKNAIFWEGNNNFVLGCNDAFCEFLNLKKEQIIGQDIKVLMSENFRKIGLLEALFDERKLELKNGLGEIVYTLVRRKQYYDKKDQKAGIVTVISDHSNIRQLEMQRKKDEQFIIQRSKLSDVGEMITSIAHQWKTPLIEISTIAQELLYSRKRKELTKEDTQECVDEIMMQVQYMTKTIDDFRSFIKPSLEKSRFSVRKAIQELLHIAEHNLKYNYIDTDIKFEDESDFIICGYPNEFKQSVLSIINNSVDSIKKRKKSETFDGLIVISVYEEKNNIFIRIQDNGIGIIDENLNRIFEPFFTSKKNGDGIGLYMVKLIIEDKMGGKIKAVQSAIGATILISLENKTAQNSGCEA